MLYLLIISLVLIVLGIWVTLTPKRLKVSDDIVHVGMVGWYLTAAAKIMGAPKQEKYLSPVAQKITGIIFIISGISIAFLYVKTCGLPVVSSICNY